MGNVTKSDMGKLPFIIAVDFDGTLVSDKYPEIGVKNRALFFHIHAWRLMGCKIILWTCRDGKWLDMAVEFCRLNGLEFDAVNKNLPEVIALFNNDTRKVYANLYIDDKNVIPDIPNFWDPRQEFTPWRMDD